MSQLAEPIEQLADRVVVGVRVLPDVQGRQRQPEHGHDPHGPGDRPGGDQPTPVGGQGGPDQLEVGQQLGGGAVVPAGLVRTALGLPGRVLRSFAWMHVSLSR